MEIDLSAWKTQEASKSTLNFFSSENRQFLAVIYGQNEVEKFFLGERPFLAVINGRTEVEKFFL